MFFLGGLLNYPPAVRFMIAYGPRAIHVAMNRPWQICGGFFLFMSLVLTRSNRGRVRRWLGSLGTRGNETQRAAAVAGLCGEVAPSKVLADATALFRAVSVSSLRAADFASSGVAVGASTSAAAAAVSASDSAVGLGERSYKAKLGEIDAFLSHSWKDEEFWPGKKYEALERWAAANEAKNQGQGPTIWLDKMCIDQNDIDAALACLPVFLSGCKGMLVIAGPSYTTRLWCIMEIFTYIQMTRGIADEQIAVVPIGEGTALEGIKESFRSFRGEKAECFKKSDKEKMLGVIEGSFGDFVYFNKAVRGVFSRAERAGPDADAVAQSV